MANITPVSTPTPQFKPKSFWQKPEGVTGLIFMTGILLGGGYLLYQALPYLITLTSNLLYLSLMLPKSDTNTSKPCLRARMAAPTPLSAAPNMTALLFILIL